MSPMVEPWARAQPHSRSPLGPGATGWREEPTWLRPWNRTEPEMEGVGCCMSDWGSQQRRARSGVEGAWRSDVGEPPLLALGKDAQVKAILVPFRWEQRCQDAQGQPAMNCFPGDSLSYSSTELYLQNGCSWQQLGLPNSFPILKHLDSIFIQMRSFPCLKIAAM